MRFLKRKHLRVAALVIGIVALLAGLRFATISDAQAGYYNAGVKAYDQGDMAQAIKLLNLSEQAYDRARHRNALVSVFAPAPNRELAALAYFQIGKAYLVRQEYSLCVSAWEHSLTLNPGNGPSYDGMSTATAERLSEEAMVVKYDLEALASAGSLPASQARSGS